MSGFYGVMVSTLDFESSDPSSNLGRTFILFPSQFCQIMIKLTPWRNGSASDSRSEGCVFKSRQGHTCSILKPCTVGGIASMCVKIPGSGLEPATLRGYCTETWNTLVTWNVFVSTTSNLSMKWQRGVRLQKCGTLHDFACHPCAGAMLIFSVSFQF